MVRPTAFHPPGGHGPSWAKRLIVSSNSLRDAAAFLRLAVVVVVVSVLVARTCPIAPPNRCSAVVQAFSILLPTRRHPASWPQYILYETNGHRPTRPFIQPSAADATPVHCASPHPIRDAPRPIDDKGSNNKNNHRTRPTKSNAPPTKPRQRRRPLAKQTKSSASKRDTTIIDSSIQTWRVFGVEVHPDQLASTSIAAVTAASLEDCLELVEKQQNSTGTEKDWAPLFPVVVDAVRKRLRSPTLPRHAMRLVRKSVDARLNQRRADGGTGPRYVYVVDVTLHRLRFNPPLPNGGEKEDPQNFDMTTVFETMKKFPWKQQPGRLVLLKQPEQPEEHKVPKALLPSPPLVSGRNGQKPRVIVVGAGPAGLFCALQLVRTGLVTPIVLERGQPVEIRGKDIGALMHRTQLNGESNFAFGEGGAGTWSDGKLTTRIGRNSEAVRAVLETLVQYGAPSNILVEGAPHLGTDNLVRLLRNMRFDLRKMGGEIHFGTKVTSLVMEDNVARGVDYVVGRQTKERNVGPSTGSDTATSALALDVSDSSTGRIMGDAVVLATGHSARDIYEQLNSCGVQLEAKGFAVGFRVEHPQKLINKIQYGQEWGATVTTGKKTTDSANNLFFQTPQNKSLNELHNGSLPVPSYRLATNEAYDGQQNRGVYSFCMCPGGQIVPASTNPDEVCVNGMSFSRRDSPWANSALVVTIEPNDVILDPYRRDHGVLAGIAFQRDMEQRAAAMGGGNLTVPVQRLSDFMAGRSSTTAPASSYRLGIKPSACHEIYPLPLVQSIRFALNEHFTRQMPGFVCDEGLLHAVETRTSSPVRIARDRDSLQAVGSVGLFPAGEGAGFAGGIVSAAVDGMVVADAVLELILGYERSTTFMDGSSAGTFY